jgi:hypothetical protein
MEIIYFVKYEKCTWHKINIDYNLVLLLQKGVLPLPLDTTPSLEQKMPTACSLLTTSHLLFTTNPRDNDDDDDEEGSGGDSDNDDFHFTGKKSQVWRSYPAIVVTITICLA